MHPLSLETASLSSVALASFLTAAPMPLRGQVPAVRPPNVLLVCVDDLKPALRSFGDPLARTPNLDRLAARGVRFENAYCNQALCGPSRFSLMLGTRSTSSGLYGFGRDFRQVYPSAVTLPQYFSQHGYVSASIGKVYHVGHGNRDDVASWSVPSVQDKVVEYLLPDSTEGGQLTREEALFGNVETGRAVDKLVRGAAWECVDVPDNAYADGRMATEAVRRLSQLKHSGARFFLAVGFARPHLPFVPPKKYWDLYKREELPLAKNPRPPVGAPDYAHKGIWELNQFKPVPQRPPLDADLERTLIHGYYAGVSYVDAQIGRVLDALDREGLADNTIVVVWGDNGYSLGTHGDWTKHSNYEEANRIPVIFAGPRISRGEATSAMFETVDIYPTLTELAGLPPPQGPQPIDGISQVPVLDDPRHAKVKDFVYHAYPRNRPGKGGEWIGQAIRTSRYRYVEWRPLGDLSHAPDRELYDYSADPLESLNLADRMPAVVAELSALLSREPKPRKLER